MKTAKISKQEYIITIVTAVATVIFTSTTAIHSNNLLLL